MVKLFLKAMTALLAVVAMLYGSWWLFEKEVMEFLALIWVAIRYFFVQLSRLTWAGIAKYLSAQFARFFTIELWKTLVIKWLKKNFLPLLLGTVFGEAIIRGVTRLSYQLRKGRILFRRWYRQQHPVLQVFFWIISGVMTLVITINLIGIGVLAFAFTLPTWIIGFLKSGIIKLWLIIQRIVFKTIMLGASTVGWKKLANRIDERHIKRIDKLRKAVDSRKLRVRETFRHRFLRLSGRLKKANREESGRVQDEKEST